MNIRRVCVPALIDTLDAVASFQLCHAPVFGTAIQPVAFAPSMLI
jgi:hypothetical protein